MKNMKEFKGTTQQECMLHYWGFIHDMVTEYNFEHGTNIKPWACVKIGKTVMVGDPQFTDLPITNYSFAVGIVEGKPIFVGDVLYWKNKDIFKGEDGLLSCWKDYDTYLTWDKPRKIRTFELNGVKLPCPEKSLGYNLRIEGLSAHEYNFCLKDDFKKVEDTINKILENARDK